MAKIGMFWGSTTDMTKEASELIHEGLEAAGHEVISHDIRNTDPSKMLEYDNLLIGSPTWNVGELQDDWEDVFNEYEKRLIVKLFAKFASRHPWFYETFLSHIFPLGGITFYLEKV